MVIKKKEIIKPIPIIKPELIKEYKGVIPEHKEQLSSTYSINYFAVKKLINNIKIIGVIKKQRYNLQPVKDLWLLYCNWFNKNFNNKNIEDVIYRSDK